MGVVVRRRAIVVVVVVMEVFAPFPGQFRVEMVEEGGGGGHAAGEDGGGEFGGGPEGGGLEVVGFVRVAGVEGDDEAHDGCDAGAGGKKIIIKFVSLYHLNHFFVFLFFCNWGGNRTRDRRRRWPRRRFCALWGF